MDGFIVQTYGAGNVPDDINELVHEIADSEEKACFVAYVSECLSGEAKDDYATSLRGENKWVTCCGKMTREYAFAKMYSVLNAFMERSQTPLLSILYVGFIVKSKTHVQYDRIHLFGTFFVNASLDLRVV